MARLNKVCPQLPAVDVSEAARWYRDKLGFTINRFYPEHGFAIVSRDDIEIHFWTCKERRIAETRRPISGSTTLMLCTRLWSERTTAAGSARSPTVNGACENFTCGTRTATC